MDLVDSFSSFAYYYDSCFLLPIIFLSSLVCDYSRNHFLFPTRKKTRCETIKTGNTNLNQKRKRSKEEKNKEKVDGMNQERELEAKKGFLGFEC